MKYIRLFMFALAVPFVVIATVAGFIAAAIRGGWREGYEFCEDLPSTVSKDFTDSTR